MYTSTSTHAMGTDIQVKSDVDSILHTYVNKYNKLRLKRQMKLSDGTTTGKDRKRSIPHGGPNPVLRYGIRVRYRNQWVGTNWVQYSKLYAYAIERHNAWAVAAPARWVSNATKMPLIVSDDPTSCAYYWDTTDTRFIFLELSEDKKRFTWKSIKL